MLLPNNTGEGPLVVFLDTPAGNLRDFDLIGENHH